MSDDAGADADADVSRPRPRAPHPDFCAWSSDEARTQALRACAWLGACEGPLGESVFGPCVVRAMLAFDCHANPALRPAGAADELWACLATVGSCGDVDACVFPSGVPRCEGMYTGCAAMSSARVICETTTRARARGVEPCALLGQTCSRQDDVPARCGGVLGFTACPAGSCSRTGAVDCDPSGTPTFDDGIDCASIGGGACVVGDGGPACAPGASATLCEGDAPPVCDGDTVMTCVGGRQSRVDCSLLGLPCDVAVPVPAYDPTAACIRRQGADLCAEDDTCIDARHLRSCGRGATYEVDCEAVGLGSCRLDVAGHAVCSPR